MNRPRSARIPSQARIPCTGLLVGLLLVLAGSSIAMADDNGSTRFTLFGGGRIEGSTGDQTEPPPGDQTEPPDDQTEPPDDQTEPPPDDQTEPPPDDQTEPPPDDQTEPPDDQTEPPDDQTEPPPDDQTEPPPDDQTEPPDDQTEPPPDDQTEPPPGTSGEDHGAVVSVDTRKGAHSGGLKRELGSGVSSESLDGKLRLDYYLESTDCGAGTPRISLRIDENDNGQVDASDGYAFGYIGDPPDFGRCKRKSWQRLDLTRDSDRRWDLSQLGGPVQTSWGGLKAYIDDRRVLTASVVHDDSVPGSQGIVLFDNVTLGGRTFEDSL